MQMCIIPYLFGMPFGMFFGIVADVCACCPDVVRIRFEFPFVPRNDDQPGLRGLMVGHAFRNIGSRPSPFAFLCCVYRVVG